jgi:hypothetical protein
MGIINPFWRIPAAIGSPESVNAKSKEAKQQLSNAMQLIHIYKLRFDSSYKRAGNDPLKMDLAGISSARQLMKEVAPAYNLIMGFDASIKANYVSANQVGMNQHRAELVGQLAQVFTALINYYFSSLNSLVRIMKALYHSRKAEQEKIKQLQAMAARAYNVTIALYENPEFRYAHDNIPDVKKRYDELIGWEGRIIDGIKQDFQ